MRAGGDRRGNTVDRRRRKLWLLTTFDTDLGPDQCRCHLMISERCRGTLDYATVTSDRLDTGGSYTRENTQPACGPCQWLQGALVTQGRWPVSA